MIKIRNLTKKYGSKTALNDISFDVEKGEILGFLGPNGAGKTTTMNIITGYISYNEGSVTIDGDEVLEKPNKVKQRIGYLPEHPPLYLDMTVFEYLSFVYDIKKLKKRKNPDINIDKLGHIEEISKKLSIEDVWQTLIKNLSKGYQQRVGLAQALMGYPDVLILDEPTVGLDPKQINEIRNLIKDLGKQHTIILSSHILQEISAICERVIIINMGNIVAIDTPENLSKAMNQSNRILLRAKGGSQQEMLAAIGEIIEKIEKDRILRASESSDSTKKAEYLDGNPLVQVEEKGEVEPGCFDFVIASEIDIREDLFWTFADKKLPILQLKPFNLTLEDIFLQLTGNGGETVDSDN